MMKCVGFCLLIFLCFSSCRPELEVDYMDLSQYDVVMVFKSDYRSDFSRDIEWFEEEFPHLREKVRWINTRAYAGLLAVRVDYCDFHSMSTLFYDFSLSAKGESIGLLLHRENPELDFYFMKDREAMFQLKFISKDGYMWKNNHLRNQFQCQFRFVKWKHNRFTKGVNQMLKELELAVKPRELLKKGTSSLDQIR